MGRIPCERQFDVDDEVRSDAIHTVPTSNQEQGQHLGQHEVVAQGSL